jgi:hypothetical protein
LIDRAARFVVKRPGDRLLQEPDAAALVETATPMDRLSGRRFRRADAGPDLAARRNRRANHEEKKLLQNGILERFRRAQADDGLRLDLDRFTGLGVAAHAGFAMRLDDAAESRNHEFTRAALGFFHGELEELFEEESCGFLGKAGFFGEVRNDLGLAQRLGCHLLFLSSSDFQIGVERIFRDQPRIFPL